MLLEDLLYLYKGCLLIVSHDRWFMNKIVDHLFVFDGDGKIKDFYGNYTDYKLAKDKALRLSRRQDKEAKPVEEKPKTQRVSNRLTYSEKKEFEGLERAIEVLEKEKASLLQKMNSGAGSSDDLMQWSVRYQEVENDLDEKTLRWIELSEKDFN